MTSIIVRDALFTASVTRTAVEQYLLSWDDGVANDWAETYDSLPVALMRLAALCYAVERDAIFVDKPADFAGAATAWLDMTSRTTEQMTGPVQYVCPRCGTEGLIDCGPCASVELDGRGNVVGLTLNDWDSKDPAACRNPQCDEGDEQVTVRDFRTGA